MTTTMPSTTVPTLTATDSPTAAKNPVWRVGVLSGLAAAAATTAVAGAARAIDIPLKAASKSTEAAKAIPLAGFATLTLLFSAIGIVLAVVLARRAKRPAKIFVVITTVLTVLSFAGPITTSHATTATRLVLSLTHVVAAAIVIPALARRLAQRPTGARV